MSGTHSGILGEEHKHGEARPEHHAYRAGRGRERPQEPAVKQSPLAPSVISERREVYEGAEGAPPATFAGLLAQMMTVPGTLALLGKYPSL